MARTRKLVQALSLHKYDVLIEDNRTRSDYFKITQFDGYFYVGRNGFLISGAPILRPSSKVLVEILNVNGDTIYSAPVAQFIEGNSRLIQAEIYRDTPIGSGKIIVLGCTDYYSDGTPVPLEWRGKYNVRWMADVVISPLVENKTPIRFVSTPEVVLEEKFYFSPSSSAFITSITSSIDVALRQTYYTVHPNGYSIEARAPYTFIADNLGGVLTGSISISRGLTQETATITLPITKIHNSTLAESEGSLIYTNLGTLIPNGLVSGSGSYITNIETLGQVEATSSVRLQYDKLLFANTGSAVSFAKIRLVNLNTFSGEVHKVRISYKPSVEPGEYVLLGDVPHTPYELLAADSASRIAKTGDFSNVVLQDYWNSATMSISRTDPPSTPPDYYYSSSLVSGTPLNRTSVKLLDAIESSVLISGSTFASASYFIGNTSNNRVELFPRSEYTLSFDAVVSRASSSVQLTQPEYIMDVYLIQESGSTGVLLENNPLGQLLGTLTPLPSFTTQNFNATQFNFVPKINVGGTFGLRFVVYGGFWNIANVSLTTAFEEGFSPDEQTILIPNVGYSDKLLTYKIEYLDSNNNSISQFIESIPTYFSGSGGGGSAASSVSSSYAASSSYSPGVAAVSFVMNGGTAPITTGYKGSLRIPTNVVVEKVGLFTSGSGSINVNILRQNYATYDPNPLAGTTIVGTPPLSMSNDIKYFDNTLSGWQTSLYTDDVLNFIVTEVSGSEIKIASVVFNLVR